MGGDEPVPSRSTGFIAPRKVLHAGRSVWTQTVAAPVVATLLENNIDCDVAIVGGGISGSLIALVLAAAGIAVCVADRRQPGMGSTIASTAMIQFEIDTPLVELSKRIGETNAARAYRRSKRAVDDLAALVARHDIDAAWKPRDALYLVGDDMGADAMQAEAALRRKVGLPSTFLSEADVQERYGIDRAGAILSQGSGELNPATTAAGVLQAAQRHGAMVFAPCEIERVQSDGKTVTLSARSGYDVRCRKAVFATGYEVIGGLPRDAFDIVSSWAIATEPVPANSFWPTRCLIWEAADPYLYMRTTIDDRILVGGEDAAIIDPAEREAAIPAKAAVLLDKARRLLKQPDLELDYAWAGAFATSPSGLPVFKELAELPGVMAILGCGGNGITFAMIAADVVAGWIAGKSDPDTDLFAGV